MWWFSHVFSGCIKDPHWDSWDWAYDGWEIPKLNGGMLFAGDLAFVVTFSSKPCLSTGG
jgi:hypothetical protein